MKQRDMRSQMVAFGRKMHGAQRIEEALVCRAHRSSQNNRRGASNPGGKGDSPDHHAREGMADAIAGGMPSSMGRPVSLAGALADSRTAIQSINWVTMIALDDDLEKSRT